MSLRPKSLKEVAETSDSLEVFGQNLRDWLHELRRQSSRPQLVHSIADEPPLLQKRFDGGAVADAWLGAYAEHLASSAGIAAPKWAFAESRIVPEPAFVDQSAGPELRALALVNSPLAFKRRNIFTDSVDLPLHLRSGRPAKSAEEKRRANAERQRRFRVRQRTELALLRNLERRM